MDFFENTAISRRKFLKSTMAMSGLLTIPLPARSGSNEAPYSFFVAGHTYGRPGIDNDGLHPPFKKDFSHIRNFPTEMQFGVLTGDVVIKGTEEDWRSVNRDILMLGIPVHIAPGNHDLLNRDLFIRLFKKTYYSFSVGKDLFVILDPNLDGWNITGRQLTFLKNTLISGSSNYRNVFVFLHQLIWWTKASRYRCMKPNSLSGRKSRSNFYSEVFPILERAGPNTYMFAGDVGASNHPNPVYFKVGNVHLIASGMGGGKRDNYLVVIVGADGNVKVTVRWLGSAVNTGFTRGCSKSWWDSWWPWSME